MDSTTLDSSLKSLEKMIIDEAKIVTYKGLSRALGVHVNTAKQLLYTFVSLSGNKYGDKVSTTYQVSGKKDDGSMFVSVIRESDLPSVRASLVDIYSEHVYSVQTGSSLSDLQLLYTVDTPEEMSCLTSPIVCSGSVVEDGKSLEFAAVKEAVFVKTKPESKPTKEKPAPVVNKEADKKQEETVKEVTKKVANVKIEQPKEKAPAKKTNSISSMFSAQSSKPKKATEKKEEKPKTEEKVTSLKEEDKSSELHSAKPKKEPNRKEKTKNKRKHKNDDVEDNNEKKRKRIRVFSDSEDSDAEDPVREKSISPEPPEPEPEEPEVLEVKIESDDEVKPEDSGTGTHKRKKRKIVDKLVMTEEGYMETTKVVVLETDSEPEEVKAKEPMTAKKSPDVKNASAKKTKSSPEVSTSGGKKTTPKQSSSPTKKGKGKTGNDGKKQATLLSFFKKT